MHSTELRSEAPWIEVHSTEAFLFNWGDASRIEVCSTKAFNLNWAGIEVRTNEAFNLNFYFHTLKLPRPTALTEKIAIQ